MIEVPLKVKLSLESIGQIPRLRVIRIWLCMIGEKNSSDCVIKVRFED